MEPHAATLVRLFREPIDLTALAGTASSDGARCLFVGVVRNETQGCAVVRAGQAGQRPLH